MFSKDESLGSRDGQGCSLYLEQYDATHVPAQLSGCGHKFGDHTVLPTQSRLRARTTIAVHYVVPSCSGKRILMKTAVASTIPAKGQKISKKRKRMKNKGKMNTTSLRK
jgi:ABC-type transporter Mla maintaining outer membrane lipid asymmetry ATPase subunit MlaF